MTKIPGPAYRVGRILLFTLCCVALCSPTGAGGEITLQERVVTIDWNRFERPIQKSEDYDRCAQVLLNSAHYNLTWAPGATEGIEKEWRDLAGRQAHDVIRPGCSAAFGLAVVLKTGVFDEQTVGVSKEEALTRTVELINAVVGAHDGAGWKYPWQSAFWAADVCRGAFGNGNREMGEALAGGDRRMVALAARPGREPGGRGSRGRSPHHVQWVADPPWQVHHDVVPSRFPLNELDVQYYNLVARRVAEAVDQAVTTLAPARIGAGVVAKDDFLVNRRWIRATPGTNPFGEQVDKVAMGSAPVKNRLIRPAGPIDPDLTVLSVQYADGRPLALLGNYAAHYGALKRKVASADYFGLFCERVACLISAESIDPPFVGMMSNGASADVSSLRNATA